MAQDIIVNLARDALAAVVPAGLFREVWTFDRGQVEDLPGLVMAAGSVRKVDDIGIRAVAHRRTWEITVTLRIWARYDPVDSVTNDREVWGVTAPLIDAIEADPTMGGRVVASGVQDVSDPILLANAQGNIVAQGIDVTVAVRMSGSWTQ